MALGSFFEMHGFHGKQKNSQEQYLLALISKVKIFFNGNPINQLFSGRKFH